MADDNQYKKFVDDASKELKRLEELQQRLEGNIQRYQQRGADKRKKQYKDWEKGLEKAKEEQDKINTSLKLEKTERKEIDKSTRSLAKLSATVRKELSITADKSSLFESISQDIVRAKAEESVLDGEAQSRAARRESIMSNVLGDLESQAKAIERARGVDEEREQFEQRRRDIKSMADDLTAEELKKLLEAVDKAETMYDIQQRTLSIQESQKSLYDSMPESIKSGVDFAKSLAKTLKTAGVAAIGLTLLVTIVTSAASAFTSLDSSAEKFNQETGLAVSQVKELRTQANNLVADFRNIGLEAQDYYDIQKEIVGVLGDTARVSDSVAGAQAVITKNFGVSNKAAAETLQIFQSLGGVSENTAASLQLQTLELAKQTGVAPAKVLEDISESSDAIYGAFRGNSKELITQAIQARRLGTNLKDVLETTDKLLDFESSITKELEASAFVGGQFNLTQARALRASGDIAGAQEEILRQIQRSGDFRQQDVFTQRALAEAAGMTVDEIARQLTVQERLNSLSTDQQDRAKELLDAGVDIVNLNDTQLEQEVQKFALQKEQQGQLTNLSNTFQGIASILGATLVPLLESITPILTLALTPIQLMAEGFSSLINHIKEFKEIYGALAVIAGIVYTYRNLEYLKTQKQLVLDRIKIMLGKKELVQEGALAGVKALSNPALALAGLAAAALVIGAVNKYTSKADDAMFGGIGGAGYGKRALLEEGQITLFNNRDTIVAGTDLDKNVENITPPVSPQYVSPFDGQLPLNKTVNEVKIVKSENNINDKLISTIERLEKAYMRGAQVNLDGQKVIRGLGRVGNETTQNNFSLV
jgi:hypothetical protein